MTEKMWNELTPGQQAYLDTLARAGVEWVTTSPRIEGVSEDEYYDMCDKCLIEVREPEDAGYGYTIQERLTPAGLLVWQQGQTPAEPDELTHLREQVATLTAERDALAAQLESIEIHHAASWEAGYYAGFAAGKRAE